jgi:ribonuclease P/MRP protein subunit POP5
MRKPQTLPPALRERRRYLAYEIISEEKFQLADLVNAVWMSTLNFLGELGTAKAGIWIVKDVYDPERKTGLIRCNHLYVEHVRTALALVQRIGDAPLIIRVVGISGTMKAAKKKFFGEKDLMNYS